MLSLRATGFPITACLHALGADWKVDKHATPDYDDETSRFNEAIRRADRVRPLPVHPLVKMNLLSMGCLSLLGYVNGPSVVVMEPLRAALKAALNLTWASPEILFFGLQKNPIEPDFAWLMAGLAIWYDILEAKPTQHQIDAIVRIRPRSRLGYIWTEASKKDIILSATGFKVGDRDVPRSEEWPQLRVRITNHVRGLAFQAISERRPLVFGGLQPLNYKQMKALLGTLDSYNASILMRIWCGCAMVGSKKERITGQPSPCECGEPTQDIQHILWKCPLRMLEPESDLHRWQELPPAYSVAHLLAFHLPVTLTPIWRRSCMRAISLMKNFEEGEEGGCGEWTHIDSL